MRRAVSLFDIDQEPLFEPLAVETEGDGEPDWDDEFEGFPTTPGRSADLEADEPEERSPVLGRRSRLLLALAVVGAVGVIGSRLTPGGGQPSSDRRTAPGPPAVVAAAHPSRAVRQRQRARPRRAKDYRATRRQRTHRVRRAPRAEPRPRGMTSPSSTEPVPATLPATPSAQAPALEPGFQGEFF